MRSISRPACGISTSKCSASRHCIVRSPSAPLELQRFHAAGAAHQRRAGGYQHRSQHRRRTWWTGRRAAARAAAAVAEPRQADLPASSADAARPAIRKMGRPTDGVRSPTPPARIPGTPSPGNRPRPISPPDVGATAQPAFQNVTVTATEAGAQDLAAASEFTKPTPMWATPMPTNLS